MGGKQQTAKWWFAVRFEHDGGQRTEYFDSFFKSSRYGVVLNSIATRFDIQQNQCIVMHKGKVLSDRRKPLIDCGIDLGETVILHKRRELDPAVDGFRAINALILQKEEHTIGEHTSITADTGDETLCAECGLCDNDAENVYCDECHDWYHWACLTPALTSLPDGEWFCSNCLNDVEEVIRPDNQSGHRKEKNTTQRRQSEKWGRGMANQGKARESPVPTTHRGHVPGIDVGQSWEHRLHCAADGIHQHLVRGICGSSKTGAVSICMSEGYDTNRDYGDWFLYTGAGGGPKNPTGSRTKQKQCMDQSLTGSNLAIALTCDAEVNKDRAVARNWTNSQPIRVVRKHSAKGGYAPSAGYRYDGLYKVVRYYLTETLFNGFRRYIFEFRRDDHTPPPWTPAGKSLIEQHGLRMIRAPRPEPMPADNTKKRKTGPLDEDPATNWNLPQSIYIAIAEAVFAVPSRDNIFAPMLAETFTGKYELVQFIRKNLTCPICQKFVAYPVTSPCGHVACLRCLVECTAGDYGCRCTLCSKSLLMSPSKDGDFSKNARNMFLEQVQVDKHLVKVLRLCFGGLWDDIDVDNQKPWLISRRLSVSKKKRRGVKKETDSEDPVPVAQSNQYAGTFTSRSRSPRIRSRTSAPRPIARPQSYIESPGRSGVQNTIDDQLFEGIERTAIESAEETYYGSPADSPKDDGEEGAVEDNADESVKEPTLMGFRELQAMHFAQHNHRFSESDIEEYRRKKNTQAQLKRSFGQMEPSDGENMADSQVAAAAAIAGDNIDSRRARKRSARGFAMESSLRMFGTFDDFE